MGDWAPGFAYPIEWDLSSTHYPLCVGLSTEEQKGNIKYESIPRYRRTKQSSDKLKEKCKHILNEMENHTGDSLAQSIISAVKEAALQPKNKKAKKRQAKHWWNDEIG